MEARKLEGAVIDHLNMLVNDPKVKDEFLKKSNAKQMKEVGGRIESLKKSIDSLSLAEKRLWEAFESEIIRLDEFGERKTELNSKKEQLSLELGKLENESIKLLLSEELGAQKKKSLKEFSKKFNDAELNVKKAILQGLIKEVRVKKRVVDIQFIV